MTTNKLVPKLRLTNPEFKYTPAIKTDIRKRFDEERKTIQAEKENKVVRLK